MRYLFVLVIITMWYAGLLICTHSKQGIMIDQIEITGYLITNILVIFLIVDFISSFLTISLKILEVLSSNLKRILFNLTQIMPLIIISTSILELLSKKKLITILFQVV